MNASKSPLRIGVVGCGSISETYLRNAGLFNGVQVVCCADLRTDQAARRAAEFGLQALLVDDLLGRDDIDLVLNLTVPAAHFDVSLAALRAGKHVFTEKPIAVTLQQGRQLLVEADRAGRLIASAPDTFLGAAGRTARKLMDDNRIGRPVAGTAVMFGRGMEHWHPDPAFYYQPGAGPLFDMGPYYLTALVVLLGPVAQVQAVSSIGQSERLVSADGPLKNTYFKVETPTTVLSLLTFRSGALVSFGTSWDVFRHSNYPIEIHGTEGSLRLPDPDTFGGIVSLSERGSPWREFDTRERVFGSDNWPVDSPDRANYRMLAVAELASGLRDGLMVPRASGQLALHVLDVMESIGVAARTERATSVNSTVDRPRPMSESDAESLKFQGSPR